VDHPEGQTAEERVAWTLLSNPAFKEAYEMEGIRIDWNAVRKVAGVREKPASDPPRGKKRHTVRGKL
jgi:hypothetical protein